LADFWLLSFDKIFLSNAEIVPSDGEIVHSDGEVVPSGGVVVPSDDEIVPLDGEVVHSDGEVVPSGGVIVPSDDGKESKDGAQESKPGEQLPEGGDGFPSPPINGGGGLGAVARPSQSRRDMPTHQNLLPRNSNAMTDPSPQPSPLRKGRGGIVGRSVVDASSGAGRRLRAQCAGTSAAENSC
jgi:hypothetical protein